MTNNNLYFDDTYTGSRFTYGLKFRPLAQSQVPDGWIIWSDRKSNKYPFGTVDYPFELDDNLVISFDMEKVE